MAATDCFVSVVAPLDNSGEILGGFVDEVMTVLRTHFTNYELILVDDGSHDDTPVRVQELLGRHACIRYIRLSRKFGAEIAIASGLDSVIGDFTVVMQPECDPPSVLPEMVAQARSGGGVVFGVRRDRRGDPFWMRMGAALFYWAGAKMFRWVLPRNTTQLRVLSRQALNAVSRIRDRYRYLRLLSFYVGYANQSFEYTQVWRGGKRRGRGFWESVALATGMIVSYSTHPLRWATWLGLLASFANLLYMGYVVAIFLLRDQVAEGWTTLSLQASGMFFLLFLILTVLAEYVGRIVEEGQDRPLYYVLEERNSNVLLANVERTNIIKDSPVAPHTSHG